MSSTTTTSTTVVLPRATADIEELAANISKLDEAIVVLAEKTKVVKATRTELQVSFAAPCAAKLTESHCRRSCVHG